MPGSKNVLEYLSIGRDSVFGTGTYSFKSIIRGQAAEYACAWWRSGSSGNDTLYTLAPSPTKNRFTITRLDTVARVVSGEFEMDLYNNVTKQTLQVRLGRFDTTF